MAPPSSFCVFRRVAPVALGATRVKAAGGHAFWPRRCKGSHPFPEIPCPHFPGGVWRGPSPPSFVQFSRLQLNVFPARPCLLVWGSTMYPPFWGSCPLPTLYSGKDKCTTKWGPVVQLGQLLPSGGASKRPIRGLGLRPLLNAHWVPALKLGSSAWAEPFRATWASKLFPPLLGGSMPSHSLDPPVRGGPSRL